MHDQKIKTVFPSQIVPSLGGQEEKQVFLGISLRDYIAIEAMKVILQDNVSRDFVANRAYKIADEMLAQREK